MEKNLPVLRVQMFGKEKITYGENPVFGGKNIVTKSMKLLFILLHTGDQGIARKKLLESLFGEEELANEGNSLRVAMHRLKKQLIDLGLPEYEYIVSRKGIYYWDSPMKMEVDVVLFEQFISKALEEECEEIKIELLKKAVDLYKGEFLQKLSKDEWVLKESLRYREMYFDALRQLCSHLISHKKYKEALKYVEPACEMYPFDDWQSVKIDCYIAMNLYKEPMIEYDDTAKLLIEELGAAPSARMMDQFDEMSKHITNRPQNMMEIKSTLQDAEERGAYFCTVPGFRDLYRATKRGIERSGQSVFLLVCTLTDSQGFPMENSKKLDEMAESLYYVIKGSIRKSDSFTKYNSSQYLVMLMGINKEDCQIVIDRITKNYSNLHKTWTKHLQCSISSLSDM